MSGEVWPGSCVFPDFTQEKTRLWWAHLVKEFVSNGVDGIWNDMNEPAVFKVGFVTLPLFFAEITMPLYLAIFYLCWPFYICTLPKTIFISSQTLTRTMPESNIHRGDIELGGCQHHSHYHNVMFFYSVNAIFW